MTRKIDCKWFVFDSEGYGGNPQMVSYANKVVALDIYNMKVKETKEKKEKGTKCILFGEVKKEFIEGVD